MKKERSSSRSLRRRLLTVLIGCLMTVIVICTVIFHIGFQRVADTVNTHTMQLVGEIGDVTAPGFYQFMLSSDQQLVSAFGTDMQIVLQNMRFESRAERKVYIRMHMAEYFDLSPLLNTEFGLSTVGFLYENGELTNVCPDDAIGDAVLADAEVYLSRHLADASEYYSTICGENCDLKTLLNVQRMRNSGDYTQLGQGYVIAWDNLSNYVDFPYDVCYGIVRYNVNWYKERINEVADIQAAATADDMDAMFREYTYIMIGAVSCVLLLYVFFSVILSKKLADPVVSEHDMLVQLNEMKTTFLSDASHELKTPLAALSGYAQNAELDLLNGGAPAVIQEKLRRISAESNRMALMVTQILDATRIEEGRMVLECSPCSLEAIVRETVETYFSVLNKNNNRLALRIPLELPTVEADSSRLQRVFVNLISNAMKHTHNGLITVRAEQDGDSVQVQVQDTGSGIAPEDMPHLWERYYKGRRAETGTGLGLFICRFIVESHGGKIWAESEVGKGTSFFFRLPLAPLHNP